MKRMSGAVGVLFLAAFLLLTMASIAPAKEAGPFYVGVFGGLVMPQDLDQQGVGDVSLDESWAIGVKGGYIIPQVKALAVELEYTYLADQDYDETLEYINGFTLGHDGDFSAHNLMVNFLIRCPREKIKPYVGFGLGMSIGTFKENVKFDSDSFKNIDDDDAAFAWQLIAGVNFEITQNWSADLAYKYFNSEYEFSDVDGVAGDVRAENHLITLGINYHF